MSILSPSGTDSSVFPDGLRVLAFDSSMVSLCSLISSLQSCRYKVTATFDLSEAREKIEEGKANYDIVITGIKYLGTDSLISLLDLGVNKSNLPVIVTLPQEDASISTLMKCVEHGACDLLLKPIRPGAIKTIWQHVVRKNMAQAHYCKSLSKNDQMMMKMNEVVNTSPNLNKLSKNDQITMNEVVNISPNLIKSSKNDQIIMNEALISPSLKSNSEGQGYVADDIEKKDAASSRQVNKKAERIKWTTELKSKFLAAVQQLGPKPPPKMIHQLMNVPGLTRTHVTSHLQKFRKNKLTKINPASKATTKTVKRGTVPKLKGACQMDTSGTANYQHQMGFQQGGQFFKGESSNSSSLPPPQIANQMIHQIKHYETIYTNNVRDESYGMAQHQYPFSCYSHNYISSVQTASSVTDYPQGPQHPMTYSHDPFDIKDPVAGKGAFNFSCGANSTQPNSYAEHSMIDNTGHDDDVNTDMGGWNDNNDLFYIDELVESNNPQDNLGTEGVLPLHTSSSGDNLTAFPLRSSSSYDELDALLNNTLRDNEEWNAVWPPE